MSAPPMKATEAIHARAVLNGSPGSPGSFATAAIELLADIIADRDRLAAEVKSLNDDNDERERLSLEILAQFRSKRGAADS